MATQQITAPAPVPQVVAHEIERERTGWTSWVTTIDHKRIGIMYLVLTFVFFLLGGTEALLIRLQLSQANNTLLDPQTYNQLITMHGTTMVFLFVVPVMAGFGNYFLPTGGVDAWIYLVHLPGVSSLVGAVNFYVTIANMRAPGMGWGRLPLFVWTLLVYAILLILALPVIAGAVTLLLTDRHFGTNFYEPSRGGSPMLWQHLFWFFGHPEVYIMVLPGFGIISE